MDKHPLRILLVEDDEDDFIITRDLLAEIGDDRFDLEWVRAFDPALETIMANAHDVYLIDYRLGERDGLELLRRAVANDCKAPIILLTSQGNQEVDVEAMNCGAADYLVKGHIDAPSLERTIRHAIDRKRTEEQLTYLAQYDPLTGLANRALLNDRLKRALARADREKQHLAFMLMDLDQFKSVNDTLGHTVGDELLKGIAERISGCVRKVDTVARLGGDEFAIVLEGIYHVQHVAAVAQKILTVTSQPMSLEGHEVYITASVGITIYPSVDDNIGNLLKYTDTAMYRAKRQGGNCYRFYTPDLSTNIFEGLSLDEELDQALNSNEFVLHYQPQVDLRTGRTCGMEALLRWQHRRLGLIPPGQFIRLAEEQGWIVPIGEWVLRTACAQNRTWQQAGLPNLRVGVNISPRQFREKKLAATVSLVLKETGLDPHCLELEIHEGTLIENIQESSATLSKLRDMGVQISIDDFGTGYSSLSYLKHLPITTVKIDQSFIQDMTTSHDDASIVTAIISLAHRLRLKVVAEGVETEEQLALLRDHGCDEVQGFLFSRPLPTEIFVQWAGRDWSV